MPSAPKKVPLKAIKTLTFYADQVTTARRTSPIPQLTCVGKACKSFQPEVVQCTNMGDDGFAGVQWRCDTDLPSSLRMGKVEVSCEGWSKAGDSNVLQGSCGLTYNLHKVDRGLEYGQSSGLPSTFDSFLGRSFNTLFWLISGIILYSLIRSLILRFSPRYTPPPLSRFNPFSGGGGGPGGGGGGDGGGGGGGGGGGWWGPGFNPGSGPGGGGSAPPPPYTKDPSTVPESTGSSTGATWGPGFWTGLAAGGLGTYLATNRNLAQQQQQQQQLGRRLGRPIGPDAGWGAARRFDDDGDEWDRGVGPSRGGRGGGAGGVGGGIGELRRATGFGGSTTR
ncbi:hypothetical protein IAR55_005691 [Kwoniella newhampshirensis]|uniref:Store-operated calcium entry-associated regulatory factor n=1 Tax=Kwoniella newhampshirensis TaxID=1651941 RepID=A0AAW0YG08_9TREE